MGSGFVLAVTGCSLLVSTSGLHGDEAADAGLTEASTEGAVDAGGAVDGGGDSAPLCPNGGGLASGSVWPMAGGCPTHVGRSALVGPQAAGDRAVFTATSIAFAGPVFAADGTVYFGIEAATGLVAVAPNGGSKWFGDTGGNVSAMSAIAADGTIYSGASFGVSALRPDGTRLFRLPANDEGDGATVVAPDGTIYFTAQDKTLRAVSPQGMQKWVFSLSENPRFSNPALGSDGTVYVGTVDGALHAITPGGAQKWRFTTGGATGSPTIGDDGTIYVGIESGALLAVTPAGVLRWTFPTLAGPVSMPAIMTDGTIVVAAGAGELFAVKPDGRTRWDYTLGAAIGECDPVIGADDTTYIGTHAGGLHAVTRDGDRLFVQSLPGRVYRQPAIGADRRLYVTVVRSSDSKGELRSIGP